MLETPATAGVSRPVFIPLELERVVAPSLKANKGYSSSP